MICFPNAKINLGLNVVKKREDGYHDIETIFYPIPIKDALEITHAAEFSFHQNGLSIEAPMEKNLVIKALRLLQERFKNISSIEIRLLKKIPFGAGLGGGSSDAAFMLRLLNDYFKLNISDIELEELASKIGADCPFFIKNKPVFATGIGNMFQPIEVSLKGKYLVLIKPNIMVSTPEAYANIIPKYPDIDLREIIKTPIDDWKHLMKNDFEKNVFNKYPLIGAIKNHLYSLGAQYASMSGSGSSVFGIFDQPVELENKFDEYYIWKGLLT